MEDVGLVEDEVIPLFEGITVTEEERQEAARKKLELKQVQENLEVEENFLKDEAYRY